MDDIIKALEGFIQQATANYKQWPYAGRAKVKNWRLCATLLEHGWECYDGGHPEGSNALELKWRKDGEEDIEVTLSFVEQQLWLRYLENSTKTGEIVK